MLGDGEGDDLQAHDYEKGWGWERAKADYWVVCGGSDDEFDLGIVS